MRRLIVSDTTEESQDWWKSDGDGRGAGGVWYFYQIVGGSAASRRVASRQSCSNAYAKQWTWTLWMGGGLNTAPVVLLTTVALVMGQLAYAGLSLRGNCGFRNSWSPGLTWIVTSVVRWSWFVVGLSQGMHERVDPVSSLQISLISWRRIVVDGLCRMSDILQAAGLVF